MEKLKRKPLSIKAVRWKEWGLWREGFKEKVSFEFRVEKRFLKKKMMDNDSGDDETDELRELG